MIKPLDTIQIENILYNDIPSRKFFRSIRSRGRLPGVVKTRPSFYIINTDYYYKQGLHWLLVAFFEDYTIFFDSFGLSPVLYNYPLLVRQGGRPLIQNTQQLQSLTSSACGYYCIYFIYFLSRGECFTKILKDFSKTNKTWNDRYVYYFVKNLVK